MDFEERAGVDLTGPGMDSFSLRLGELPNGQPILMPVMAVTGRSDGPTFFVNACMHGDEVLGADVVRRLMRSLDPDAMIGRVIAVPVANPTGQATRTRRNIMEMYPGPHDMNRIFPGVSDGVLTERIASVLDTQFSSIADYVFDLHCASVGGLWEPYTTVPPEASCTSVESFQRTDGFARAFGAPLVLLDYIFHGSLIEPVLKRGGTASMAEFGVANSVDPENRDFGIQGLKNLLMHIGILEGSPIPARVQRDVLEMHRLRINRGGYFDLLVPVGTDVVAGQLLAVIDNLQGDVLQEIRSPIDGRVCRINTMGVVGTGDYAAFVGRVKGDDEV